MLWLLGAFSSACGSCLSNFGMNLQKLGLALYNLACEDLNVPPEERTGGKWTWRCVLGVLLMMGGALGDFIALGMTAASIVAPVKGVTLISNLFFAKMYLGERVSNLDYIAAGIIFVGCSLSVIFGPRSDNDPSMDQMTIYFQKIPYLVYACVAILCVTFACRKLSELDAMLMEVKTSTHRTDNKSPTTRMEHAQQRMIADAEEDYQEHGTQHPFLYAAISGIIGSQSLTFGKILSLIFSRSVFRQDTRFDPFWFTVATICLASFVVLQAHFLQKALKIGESLLVIPIFQAFWILFSTVGGMIFFEEYKNFEYLNGILFASGFAIIFAGLATLCISDRRKKQETKDASDSESDDYSDLVGLSRASLNSIDYLFAFTSLSRGMEYEFDNASEISIGDGVAGDFSTVLPSSQKVRLKDLLFTGMQKVCFEIITCSLISYIYSDFLSFTVFPF